MCSQLSSHESTGFDHGSIQKTTTFKSGDGGDSSSTSMANWTRNGNSSKNATPEESGDWGHTILNIIGNVSPRHLGVTIVDAKDTNINPRVKRNTLRSPRNEAKHNLQLLPDYQCVHNSPVTKLFPFHSSIYIYMIRIRSEITLLNFLTKLSVK